MILDKGSAFAALDMAPYTGGAFLSLSLEVIRSIDFSYVVALLFILREEAAEETTIFMIRSTVRGRNRSRRFSPTMAGIRFRSSKNLTKTRTMTLRSTSMFTLDKCATRRVLGAAIVVTDECTRW